MARFRFAGTLIGYRNPVQRKGTDNFFMECEGEKYKVEVESEVNAGREIHSVFVTKKATGKRVKALRVGAKHGSRKPS